MKRIINGKKYDTETAECVAERSNGYPVGDFHRVKEALYRKRTGECFLHAVGGALSQYSEKCGGNGYSGSARIIPMTESDAKAWAEIHCDADDYEKLFGPVAE